MQFCEVRIAALGTCFGTRLLGLCNRDRPVTRWSALSTTRSSRLASYQRSATSCRGYRLAGLWDLRGDLKRPDPTAPVETTIALTQARLRVSPNSTTSALSPTCLHAAEEP